MKLKEYTIYSFHHKQYPNLNFKCRTTIRDKNNRIYMYYVSNIKDDIKIRCTSNLDKNWFKEYNIIKFFKYIANE